MDSFFGIMDLKLGKLNIPELTSEADLAHYRRREYYQSLRTPQQGRWSVRNHRNLHWRHYGPTTFLSLFHRNHLAIPLGTQTNRSS